MSNDKVAATTHGTEPEPEGTEAQHPEARQPEVQHGKRPATQPTVEHSGPTGVTVTVQPAPAAPEPPAEGTEEPEGTEGPTEPPERSEG